MTPMLDGVLLDIRYACRTLRRNGFFALTATLTLGLGIGVVTASFAVVTAVLLHPLVPDQQRVVRVSKLDVQRGNFPLALSLPEFVAWRDQSRSFDVLAAVDHAATGPTAIVIDGQMSAAQLAPVSADFFRVVHGSKPLYGRWLRAEDEQPGAELVAVVSERFWRRASGGDPAFVGRRLSWAGNRTLRVVGVAPATVDYPLGTEIWSPGAAVFDGQAGRFDGTSRTFFQFELLGRLAAGVSLDEARAELAVIHSRVSQAFPNDYRQMQVVVEPLLDAVVGSSRRVLLALFAAAGLVFVIAGMNVAALLLMRSWDRRREVAIRVAVGASHWHLLRQAVIEGLVLASLAAICGLLSARVLLVAVLWLELGGIPRIEHAALDWGVLAFSLVAALAWVVALGTVPIWARRNRTGAVLVGQSFKGARGTKGLLVFTVAEVAAAVVVAIGVGLLVRTFAQLQAIERGFNPTNRLVVSLLLPEARQRDPSAMLAFYERLLPQVEALPGVMSASPIHMRPGTGALGLSAPMIFEGQTREDARTNPWSVWEPVVPDYFRTLGIPIVRGRDFTVADRRASAPVAVVSQSVAQRYWPDQDPLGKRLQFVARPEWPWVTVIGVAADTRYRELTRAWMTVYFSADQFFYFQPTSLVLHVASVQDALVPAILQRVRAVEPAATVESVALMDTLLARELSRPLAAVTITGVFGLMATVLAAVGVFSVLSYEVRQRRRELAIRSAVGATPADIFRSVIRRSLIVGVAGAAAGLLVAMSVTHTLRSLLFGVEPVDLQAFLTGAGVLLVVVLVAAYFPARAAAGTDPAATLHTE